MRQRDGANVPWQNAEVTNTFRRADEEVLIVLVQSPQGSDDIPDVSSDAEIREAAQIDGNLHELI